MNLADISRVEVLHMAERETQGWKMMIGGEWVDSVSGQRYTTIDPSIDSPLADVPDGTAIFLGQTFAFGRNGYLRWHLN